MHWVNSVGDLHKFVLRVATFAPDLFDAEPLAPENQLTLESAFEELGRGVEFFAARGGNEEAARQLTELLVAARRAYDGGDSGRGADLLETFGEVLREHPGRKRRT